MVNLNKELQAGQGALGQKMDRLTTHVFQMTTHPPSPFGQSLIAEGGSEAPDVGGQRQGQRPARPALDTGTN